MSASPTTVVFADSTGLIRQVLVVPSPDAAALQAAPAGMSAIILAGAQVNAKAFMDTSYVQSGSIAAKQTISAVVSASTITADGTAEAVISGLPNPCTVVVSGPVAAGPEIVNDGSVVLSCDTPGSIVVSVAADPAYMSWSGTIYAV
jgi:UDP-glucose 6-dehydrogenase